MIWLKSEIRGAIELFSQSSYWYIDSLVPSIAVLGGCGVTETLCAVLTRSSWAWAAGMRKNDRMTQIRKMADTFIAAVP
jgi:hypothetical protein